ncbi:nucleoporin Nup37-like isoform X1 [Ptychodera flava]|uniref:nucleoporin Nup37-like isoform X1 n=2 Tax=Ptychodera flava TaxID=63121 RepID=UPI003969BB74
MVTQVMSMMLSLNQQKVNKLPVSVMITLAESGTWMDSRGRAFLCTHLLMVAEKKGTVRFYDLTTHQPIMSLDAGHVALMSADICFLDPVRIGCIANGNWMMWDSTRSSLPQENRQAHNEGGRNFRWSRVSENLFATTGQNEVKVFHLGHSQVPVSSSLPVTAGGLSWHATLPVCAVGGDRKVHLWMTEI